MNTDTPETDGEWNRLACQDHPEFERNLADFARKLERERDKAQEALKTGGLLDIIDRAGHDRAEAIRERDEARKWSAMLADAGDEIRAQLREEQQLHIQTLNERDEARQWESQALVARIQRDRVSKTLGEVREILCNALPNENQLTSFMAVKLVKERDQWRNEHDRVVREFQHRLTVIGISVIDATSYPESTIGDGSPDTNTKPMDQ